MEDALRSNLTQALSSKFDNILLNDSTAGLLGGGLTAPNDPSSVVDWPGYKGLLTNQVDGHYASMPDQVRMLIGSKTYTHMETLYRVLAANGGVNESSYELLVRKSGGVRISSHVVAPSANIQGLIAVRRPSALHTVMPLWRGITLIPGPRHQSRKRTSSADRRCSVRAFRASLCGFWTPQSQTGLSRHE